MFVEVAQLIDVIGIEVVAQTITELQLRNQFEERKIEVTTDTYFHHRAEAFQTNIVVTCTGQVDHAVDACHHIGAVVVPSWSGKLDVDRKGDIGVLHVLRGLGMASFLIRIQQVNEG